MTLLIMAAGMGSRFGGLKQIEPVGPNGEFIIDYSIYDAKLAGFDKVVFIIKEENYDIFKNTIGARFENMIDVEYVFQKIDDIPMHDLDITNRIKPWGTAHAILAARDVVKDKFAIINADDFYGRDAFNKISDFLQNSNDNEMAIVGYEVANTITDAGSVKRGVLEEENGYLKKLIESVIEKKNDSYLASPLDGRSPFEVKSNTLVSMNMMGFSPKLFKYLEEGLVDFFKQNKSNLEKCEYLIPDVVEKLTLDSTFTTKIIHTNAVWLGMTYKEDKEMLVREIEKLVRNNTYPIHLTDYEKI